MKIAHLEHVMNLVLAQKTPSRYIRHIFFLSCLLYRYAVGQWLGIGNNFTVVDTPGFGDSENDDNSLIDEVDLF